MPCEGFMKIGIVDADLIGRKKHRFPNLACEKISGYWKDKGADVKLLLDYNSFDSFDKVYISKVFTDTPVPSWIKKTTSRKILGDFEDVLEPEWIKDKEFASKIKIGGTGFFFDKATNLRKEIEHHMPDYHLYDEWISEDIKKAAEGRSKGGIPFDEKRYRNQYKEYLDYSIGFVTRGCFRKCAFCVNQKFDSVFQHSPLDEFYDPTRKKLCLLDDNFFGCPEWKGILNTIINTGKPYKFKQGLDERLLNAEKCKLLFESKYDGDLTFAFDSIADYDVIHQKLKLIKEHKKSKGVMCYVLVGFESTDAVDIESAFKRIELLMKYNCVPYLMRYMSKSSAPWKESEYRSMYVSLARWCNQPSIFKKMSFRQFCMANQALHKTEGTLCSSMRGMSDFEKNHPKIAKKYFDIRFEDYR